VSIEEFFKTVDHLQSEADPGMKCQQGRFQPRK
jgi:hypothetical protein